MLRLTRNILKSYKFDKKWWAISLKNAQLEFGEFVFFHSAFFSSTFFYSLKLVTNQALEFFTIFIVSKLGVVYLIKTTYRNYIYFHEEIEYEKVYPPQIR